MKTIVGRLVELIAFLFSLFGGFLKLIAPPEEAEASYSVGLASVLSLLLFLLLSVVVQKKSSHAQKILFAVAVGLALVATAAGFIYRSQLRALTFAYPPGAIEAKYIAGTELTIEAREDRKKNAGFTDSQLVAKYGGMENRDLVWPRESRDHAATILTAWYVVFVISVFGAVFCLTEGVLAT